MNRLNDFVKTHRLPLLILALTVAQLIFISIPFFIHGGKILHEGMGWEDAFDLLAPLAFIPLLWLLFNALARDRPTTFQTVLFFIFSAIWVEGHGIHNAADTIGNTIGEDTHTPGGSLIFFYDQTVGHYVLQIGMIGHSLMMLYRGWFSKDVVPMGNFLPYLIGGLWYGFTFAGISVSGPTLLLAIPASVAIILLGIWRLLSREKLGAAGMIFIPGYMFGLILIFVFRSFCFLCHYDPYG